MRAALFIDLQSSLPNLDTHKFAIDFLKLRELLEDEFDVEFTVRNVYSKQYLEKATKFIHYIQMKGYSAYIGNHYWNTHMGIHAAEIMDSVDAFVLISNYQEHAAILEYAKKAGKYTFVVSDNPPKAFLPHCEAVSFPTDALYLREKCKV